jgi:predicted alpha/beta-hydrolase family hydrolase
VGIPMLFLQGTRDRLANLEYLSPLCDSLGDRAHVHVLESGDHSFKPLKSSGRTQRDLIDEALTSVASWVDKL